MIKSTRGLALALALCATAAPLATSQAAAGIEVGVLTCSVVPGSRLNLLIRSTADVTCTYAKGGTVEEYVGETGIALGLDLSFRQDEKMAFTVIAASEDVSPGARALGGRYIGGELSAAAGLGLGAKALLGAGSKHIGLQPLALESSTGFGASGGLSFLYIEPVQ